ncbi:MAG: chaperone NapD [Geobacter sp.]|nr:chaperone NapD [Geobacter sp.]
MPVSGVVIKCRPEYVTDLSETLPRPGEVEIHGILPDGRLIAVIEADSVEGEVQVVSRLLETEGVIDVQLAYHNFEDVCESADGD